MDKTATCKTCKKYDKTADVCTLEPFEGQYTTGCPEIDRTVGGKIGIAIVLLVITGVFCLLHPILGIIAFILTVLILATMSKTVATMTKVVAVVAVVILIGTYIFAGDAPESDMQPTAIETPAVKETPAEQPTPTYQDSEYLSWATDTLELMISDMSLTAHSYDDLDDDGVEIYSEMLCTDANEALNEIDQFDVSPALKPSKNEFELALRDFKQAGYYGAPGARNYDVSDTDTSVDYLESGVEHSHKATNLLPIQ